MLRRNVNSTRGILKAELEIALGEVREQLHFSSLERIFIEERIYKDKEFEQSSTKEEAALHIDRRLEPWKPKFIREVTMDDLLRLLEIKMARILKFSSDQAEEKMVALNERADYLKSELDNLTDYTIRWFEGLKEKYGDAYPRHTQIRSFDNIEAANVAEANEKLYINREDGFVGTSLKKDEYLCTCSSMDDIIIFYKDGRYKVTRVQDKIFVGKNVLYVNVFKRNDARTIYNVIYQDGKGGTYYQKRFNIMGVTRDRDYDVTQGKPGSRIVWFTANPNGEAEVVKVTLKPKPRLKSLFIDVDFSKLAVKGKAAMGNIVTRNEVHRFSLKEKGRSTLGGRNVWFDPDVLRLNYDGRGEFLGEFGSSDQVLVIMKSGEYFTTSFEASNHYDDGIMHIMKLNTKQVWSAVLFDADQQGYPYLKRFTFEPSVRRQSIIGENPKSRLVALSSEAGARFEILFGGADEFRGSMIVAAPEFISVKSVRAKGKRLTTYEVGEIREIEPIAIAEPELDEDVPEENTAGEIIEDPDSGKSSEEVRDEITGQQRMF